MRSRVMLTIFGAIILVGAGFAFYEWLGSTTPTARPRSAELSELRNAVQARDNAEAVWQLAAIGQQIHAGGGAKTGDEARARVDISDGSIVRLAANTEFELMELAPEATDSVTRLKLMTGKAWVYVLFYSTGRFVRTAP